MTEIIIAIISGVVSIVCAIIANHTLRKNKEMDKFMKNMTTLPPLQDHKIHANLNEYARYSKEINIDDGINPARRELSIDFLLYAIEVWQEPVRDFAKLIDSCSQTCDDAVNCNKIYAESLQMYERGMKYTQNDMPNLKPEDREAYLVFRNKFIAWNSARTSRLYKKIMDVAQIDDVYKTCEQKGNRILEEVDDYVFTLVQDAKKSICSLNGTLSGKTYKGMIL